MKRICVLCGHEFETDSSRRMMCYRDHFHPCPICNCDVLTSDMHHMNNCCCKEHTIILRKLTTKQRYPNNEHMNRPESLEKRRLTNPFCSETGQKYLTQKRIEKYGVDSCSKLPWVVEKRKATCMNRYGVSNWNKSELGKETMLQNLKQKYHKPIRSTLELDEVKAKCAKTNLARYNNVNPMKNKKIWLKQRTNSRSRFVADDGTKLDSKYEVAVYDFCVRNKLSTQTNIPIKYKYQDADHVTYIDFCICDILFETKGEHILDGYFDYRGVPIAEKLLVYRNNSVIVITGESKRNMFNQSTGCVGIDINLFRLVTKHRNSRYNIDLVFAQPDNIVSMYLDESIRWIAITQCISNNLDFIGVEEVLRCIKSMD